MRRSNFFAILAALAVVGYLVTGFVVAFVLDAVSIDDLIWLAPVTLLSSVVGGGLVYAGFRRIPPSDPRINGGFFGPTSLGITFVLALLGGLQAYSSGIDNYRERKQEEARWNALSEEEKQAKLVEKHKIVEAREQELIRQKQLKDQENDRFSKAMAVANSIKQIAHDPASFDVVSLATNKEVNLVCITYRAKNPFNATVLGFSVWANGKTYNNNKTMWNQRCEGATFTYVWN